jgi:hypothetical protein
VCGWTREISSIGPICALPSHIRWEGLCGSAIEL